MHHEKAHDDLQKLKMQGGNINQYITDLQFLSTRAKIDVDNPAALHMFQLGLSIPLAEACINLEKPANFKQWALVVQEQQRNWIKK